MSNPPHREPPPYASGPQGHGVTYPAMPSQLDQPTEQFPAVAPTEPAPNDVFGPHEAFGPPPEEMPPPEHEATPVVARFRKIRSHAKHRRVPRFMVFLLIVGLAAAGAGLRFWPGSPFHADAGKSDASAAGVPFRYTEITPESLGTEGFLSWAYLDRRDGTVVGSANMAEPSDSASLMVTWFGADYLRRSAELGATPSDADLADVQAMIRDGDLAAANRIVAKLGAPAESIGRLVSMCQLHDSGAFDGDWGRTVISAGDTVRLGACLADGRAAGAQWTPLIMDAMRQVPGDAGIRAAFRSDQRGSIAVANGSALREDGIWYANCLAIHDTWALAVTQRYPSNGDRNTDLAHIAAICRDVVHRISA